MTRPTSPARLFTRISRFQRLQHGLLLASFTVLALTGLPMRFPEVRWLGAVYAVVGGLPVARVIHRSAALVMILDGLLHLIYVGGLLIRSRFDWRRAWPMVPARKDLRDFVATSLYYLGRRRVLPAYDRFNFREKFDYFAVFWGLPVMMFSGLVLWFPVWFGNRLPDLAIGAATIAHSDEAILAISAIVVWHLYNVHVAPGRFHRFRTWIDGRISREEMIVAHPLEYERLTGETVEPAERQALVEQAGLPGMSEPGRTAVFLAPAARREEA
ncbi:MAG TPA: cytochrome b/b6 domain-containing protein [Candidatus Eisenbacteria bacterium]